MRPAACRPWRLAEAVRWLRAGGVVAYPTEAVFGLGCDPLCESAVRRILAIKKRPVTKGLVLVADEPARLTPWVAPMAPAVRDRVEATWPGPYTWVVPARAWVPAWLTGGSGRLAVRVSGHPVAAGLARAFGAPLVSTSANRRARRPERCAQAVRRRLGAEIDHVVGERVGGLASPSEVRDALTGAVLRAAPVRPA